jgi:polyisoprenoid-binding protein YceI
MYFDFCVINTETHKLNISTMKKLFIAVMTMAAAGASFAQSTWTIDRVHSKIGFSAIHMVVAETDGKFDEFEGTVVSKKDDFDGAEVTFTAKVASINTENEKRDAHLKSDDFFNAEKYPDIRFSGTLTKAGGKYQLKGKLTMRDVTRDVSFDVTYGGQIDTGRGVKAGFKFTGVVNRQDYGLKFSNTFADGKAVVGNEVTITCKIELDKKS